LWGLTTAEVRSRRNTLIGIVGVVCPLAEFKSATATAIFCCCYCPHAQLYRLTTVFVVCDGRNLVATTRRQPVDTV
jgi:hypothetical protein